MPKVSVLLTSYNHGDYIGESIESILNQTFKDFELVILDDASTDNSVEVIKKYKDKRIKTIFRKKNLCRAICKEIIEPLEGEYIAIAHCDDKWEKDKLEKQVKYLDKHKNTAACFTWVGLINENGEILSDQQKSYTVFNVKNKTRYEWLNHFFNVGNCLCHPSVLLRKSVQINDDLYTNGLGALPDFYRWVKLLLKYDIHILEEELTYFRVRSNGENSSGINPANLIRNSFDVYKVLDLYKSIEDKNMFLKIFPEAKKYMVKKEIIIEYALAQMCLNANVVWNKSYKFYGLNLLYELLQNEKTEKKLKELYDYNHQSFIKEVANNDIFGVIKKENFMDVSIFLEVNSSFDEKNKLFKVTSIDNNKGGFRIKFINTKKNVNKIRIDLDEDVYRAYKELNIYINGNKINFEGNRTIKIDDELIFLTADPQIIIDSNEDIKTIEISGKTRLVSNIEYEKIIFENIAVKKGLLRKIKEKIFK